MRTEAARPRERRRQITHYANVNDIQFHIISSQHIYNTNNDVHKEGYSYLCDISCSLGRVVASRSLR